MVAASCLLLLPDDPELFDFRGWSRKKVRIHPPFRVCGPFPNTNSIGTLDRRCAFLRPPDLQKKNRAHWEEDFWHLAIWLVGRSIEEAPENGGKCGFECVCSVEASKKL